MDALLAFLRERGQSERSVLAAIEVWQRHYWTPGSDNWGHFTVNRDGKAVVEELLSDIEQTE